MGIPDKIESALQATAPEADTLAVKAPKKKTRGKMRQVLKNFSEQAADESENAEQRQSEILAQLVERMVAPIHQEPILQQEREASQEKNLQQLLRDMPEPTVEELQKEEIFANDTKIMDDETYYRAKITSAPRLSREQEIEVAMAMEKKADTWKKVLLSIPMGYNFARALFSPRNGERGEKTEKQWISDAILNIPCPYEELQECRKCMEQELADAMEKHRTTKDQSSSMITKGSHNRNSMQTLSDLERLREAEAAWLASREQLVLCNTRLISGFVAKNSDRGMDIADLRQTGVVGLIIGADRYDHRMGYKFGTYASWWIRQAIQRGIQLESKSIRLPANQYITLAKMHRFKENYRKENAGMDPTNVEIAQVLGMTLRNLEDLLAISQPTRYLDKPVGETDDTMADSIEDKKALDPFGSAVVQARREAVEDMLKILTGRERKIIELRFGLENGQPHTLNEIAKLYRLTRERVRQLQNKGLAKLSRRFGDRADLAELISDA